VAIHDIGLGETFKKPYAQILKGGDTKMKDKMSIRGKCRITLVNPDGSRKTYEITNGIVYYLSRDIVDYLVSESGNLSKIYAVGLFFGDTPIKAIAPPDVLQHHSIEGAERVYAKWQDTSTDEYTFNKHEVSPEGGEAYCRATYAEQTKQSNQILIIEHMIDFPYDYSE